MIHLYSDVIFIIFCARDRDKASAAPRPVLMARFLPLALIATATLASATLPVVKALSTLVLGVDYYPEQVPYGARGVGGVTMTALTLLRAPNPK